MRLPSHDQQSYSRTRSYTLGFTSPVGNDIADDVNLSDVQNSFFSAVVNIGAMAGSLSAGFLADHLGRKLYDSLITLLSSRVDYTSLQCHHRVVRAVRGWIHCAMAGARAYTMTTSPSPQLALQSYAVLLVGRVATGLSLGMVRF